MIYRGIQEEQMKQKRKYFRKMLDMDSVVLLSNIVSIVILIVVLLAHPFAYYLSIIMPDFTSLVLLLDIIFLLSCLFYIFFYFLRKGNYLACFWYHEEDYNV